MNRSGAGGHDLFYNTVLPFSSMILKFLSKTQDGLFPLGIQALFLPNANYKDCFVVLCLLVIEVIIAQVIFMIIK
jgi:hypothetical protein